MKSVTAPLTVRILFGAVVLLLAFNLLSSAYQVFSTNTNPSLAGQAGLSTTALLMRAFLIQSMGYRLTMFVVAMIALVSKRASHIFLFSLGILVLNLYEIVFIVATGVYNTQLIAAVVLVSIAGYCLWHTKASRSAGA